MNHMYLNGAPMLILYHHIRKILYILDRFDIMKKLYTTTQKAEQLFPQ